ncbi:apolipoprotein N-acyltransferase [Agaribacter flavus]|uniref:Apolipoprotein N-acyltransferase n=1 Tax=Agaribacter flavus TaxID=1902781 RepID=A0ABV7FLB6_9ALTE
MNTFAVNAIATLLGASLTFAFAPFGQWYLVYICLPLGLYLLHQYSSKPVQTAWWFGLGYFGAGISWVHVSIATFGGLPLVVSLFLMLLLCGYLALFPAICVAILSRFFTFALWPLAIPLVWLVTEWVRAHFLTGFPWLSIAYSQIDSPLSGMLPVIGEIGVSALVLCISASIAVGIAHKKWLPPVLLSLLLFTLGWTTKSINWVTESNEKISVALVQGNIEQSIRWQPEQDIPTIEKYKRLSETHWSSDIVIWPEAAIPVLESMPLALETLRSLDELATSHNTALITGSVDYQGRTQEAYNNLLALGMDIKGKNTIPYSYRHENRFSKHHLLPIGEFVPFESLLRPLAPIFDLPMSSFNRGDFEQENLLANGYHLVPAICYEIAFPKQVKANIKVHSDLLVTVSNDAWFGDSHGPHQHLEIARMRAIEFALPIVRATNTGVTAAFDHRGDNLGQLDQFVDDVLNVNIALVEGRTPYFVFGDIPIYLLSTVLFVIACFVSTRSKA